MRGREAVAGAAQGASRLIIAIMIKIVIIINAVCRGRRNNMPPRRGRGEGAQKELLGLLSSQVLSLLITINNHYYF